MAGSRENYRATSLAVQLPSATYICSEEPMILSPSNARHPQMTQISHTLVGLLAQHLYGHDEL